MRRFNLYLQRYDWVVRVYVAVTHYGYENIAESLEYIHCSQREIDKAIGMLKRDVVNSGLCYSDSYERMSVIVIKKTDSPEELLNSVVHEVMHAAMHISGAEGIDYASEEPCYIAGDIARGMYMFISDLLCAHCRKGSRDLHS